MIPREVEDVLQRTAAGVVETAEAAAVEKLLERVAGREDAEQLRAALVTLGARSLIRGAVAGERQHDAALTTEVAGVVRRLEGR